MQKTRVEVSPRGLRESVGETIHGGSSEIHGGSSDVSKHDVSYNFPSGMARHTRTSYLISLDGSCVPVRGVRMRNLLRSR